jgi:CBS domain-containing protein
MNAKELMSSNLVVVPPAMPVTALAELLAARGISAVPVVDAQGTPLGIVTEGDLIRRLADQPPGPFGSFLQLFAGTKPLIERFAKAHGACARDVMSAELVSVPEDASAERIAHLMETHGIRRVLVLAGKRLVGIVSRADLLRAVLRSVPSPQRNVDDGAILRSVIAAMRELRASLQKLAPAQLSGEIPTAHKPRALLAPLEAGPWAMAVAKGNPDFLAQINAFLKEFRAAGGFDKLADQYLKAEKAALAAQGVPFIME